jgi:Concanavalin A-like lectin/glucanases superfamily
VPAARFILRAWLEVVVRTLAVRVVAAAVSLAVAGGLTAGLAAGVTPSSRASDLAHGLAGGRVTAAPGSARARGLARGGSGGLAGALAAARRLGRRVEVVSLRTPTSQAFANPSGTMTLVEHAQRVRAVAAAASGPVVSLGLASWGNVVNVAPNQTMAQDPFRSDGAKAGDTCDANGCYVYRAGFAFGLGGLYGKHILSATLGITMVHSWECSPTPTQLWLTSAVDQNSSTWNNLGWLAGLDTQSATANANCGQSPVYMVFSGGLAGQVQNGANSGWPTISVGLIAPDESTTNDFKRFNANPTLSVTYNSIPNPPDTLTVDGKPCATGAGRPYIADLTPTLTAHVSDPDNDQNLDVTFAGAPLGGSLTTWASQDNLANGGTANIKIPAGILADRGVYTFQAYTTDHTDNSSWSGACEFGVAATPPGPPTVTSADYPNDQAFHGMRGVTGHFVFSPPTSHPEDVAAYLVGLNCGQPGCAVRYPADASFGAAADITPNLDGTNFLDVWTENKANLLSNNSQPVTYSFLVRSGTGPAAQYPLTEGTGTTAADATGHGNTATLTGGVSWINPGRRGTGPALHLSGTNGTVATSGQVSGPDPNTGAATPLRTDRSFTVTAWVRQAGTTFTRPETVVGIDGIHVSGFLLGEDNSAGPPRWRFEMHTADADNDLGDTAWSTATPTLGTWTHLAGVFDAGTHTMSLYVDGVLAGTASHTSTWDATGPLVIGREKWQDTTVNPLLGDVSDVRLYARVLSPAEIAALANAPALAGDWELGEGSGTTAHDTSGAAPAAAGTLSGGTSWVLVNPADARPADGGLPPGATALNFDGSTGMVTAPDSQVPFPVPVADPVATVYNGGLHVTARATGTSHLVDAVCVKCDGSDWQYQDLGGPITGKPSVIVFNGQLHVIADGSDGKTVLQRTYDNGWGAWQTAGCCLVAPATALYNNDIQLFGRDPGTGHLITSWCAVCDGSDWHFGDLGGVITGAPSVVAYSGQLQVIADGSDGATLFHKWFVNGFGWHDWQGIAGSSADPVTTVYNGALHVTSRATDTGHVKHAWCVTCDGSDWHLEDLGGVITGTPSVTVYNGQFRIIANGSDGASVWQKYWTGSAWVDWQPVAAAGDQPYATAYNNQIHVIATAPDTGRAVHIWCSACDGTDWRSETAPIVNTARSFTVAAWVRLTATANWQTAVGLDGTNFDGFRLVYDPTVPGWAFSMATSDAAPFNADWATARSIKPAIGTWTHLAGVFDAETHTMSLYVDGTLAATASHTSLWTAAGSLRIGMGQYNGVAANGWTGDLASVQVYSGVLSAQQIANLAGV